VISTGHAALESPEEDQILFAFDEGQAGQLLQRKRPAKSS